MQEKLALLGGSPVRSEPYPPYNTIGDEEKKLAMEVLNSGILSGFVARGNEQFYGGKYVNELESLFCRRFDAGYAVSFNSATSGLHGALMAAGVGPGDEVIVPPYSMSATAAVVLMCYAVPVFVDVEPDMFCIDPSRIEAAISSRTKAIITVNLFGMPSALNAIVEIAGRHKFLVIEDNAQSPGAFFRDRFSGTIGDMGVFSLNRHKTIQCGEGGVVLTNSSILAERMQLCRNHGEIVLLDWGRDEHADIVGFNYRLSELHAAVAVPQLKKLDELNKARITLANYLTHRLKEIDFLRPPKIRESCNHVYYLYPMVYERRKLGIKRDTLINALLAEGVQACNYAPPIYMCPLFQKFQRPIEKDFRRRFPEYDKLPNYLSGICPEVESLYKDKMVVTNICRPPQTEKDIDQFICALKKIEACIDDLRKYEEKE
ncbi:MAG: DegT/DnrJ/EryC1/StrS family aminotransferase [Nitrospirae bacterium]|nr:DegT/DnrJ/EryC1/StrS family aminotransferase [Nitrospirota bacterium]